MKKTAAGPPPRPLMSAFATAQEAASAIRSKTISAQELLSLTFERIDRYDPVLNAIVWQDRDQALARARAADAALAARRDVGQLHGVPVTIKECLAYRGSPSTWGVPALKDAPSARTAVAVERLESAGAIVVGKTNVPVMLADWQTDNPVYGTTNNPWDVTRTPGGSTGGGAAAVAAGLGCLTIGTDLSGSIRIPAHFCGVYGHKPSLGLVSTSGLQPGPWDGRPGYPMDVSVVSPIARSARDLALALNVLGGPNGEDAAAWGWRMPAARHTSLRDFRVGYVLDEAVGPVSSDVGRVLENVFSELGRLGTKMDRGWPVGVDHQAHLRTFQYLVFALVTSDATADQREQARKRLKDHPDDIAAAATVEPHARWLRETQLRLMYRDVWQKYFERYDVFLMPTTFTAAFPHDHRPMEERLVDTPEGQRSYLRDIPAWITFASVAGLPATVAPIGRTDRGLPVGVQIVGPMWEDSTPIEFASLLSEIMGGFTPPPRYED